MKQPESVRPADLMSHGDVLHTLRVDKSTLSRWVAAGRLDPVMIAGVRFYQRADVERIAAQRASA
ncbi:MAG TPA: helix-turn-helix domain-containing protein [Mycobacterium sp.]|jgi:predicted site-specific integrase-resolvase